MYSEPVISVIVPIYNVETYLDRCVSSIVNQTYRNLEIILVDDGSPDSSPDMCDVWAEKDSRIKVIHKTNGGLSDARNAGMAAATGELMGFVDSDDWVSPDMYQLLFDRMMIDESDIAACGVEMVWEDDTPSRLLTPSGNCILSQFEAMKAIIQESWLKLPVWYKLYKTEMIRDISFPKGKYHEDAFWSYQAIGKAKCVSVFDKPCYFYTQRSGSIMGNTYSLKRLDGLDAKIIQERYIREHFPGLIDEMHFNLLFSCIYAMQQCLKFLPKDEIVIAQEKIEDTINVIKPFRHKKAIGLKQSLWFYLAQISIVFTSKLRNFLKLGL